MNIKNVTLKGLPAVIMSNIERDSTVPGTPTRRDYEIQVGSQSGDNVESEAESLVLLTIERGKGRNYETVLEINLEADQARLMAGRMFQIAAALDKLLVDPGHIAPLPLGEDDGHSPAEYFDGIVERWKAEAAALGLPINQALMDALMSTPAKAP